MKKFRISIFISCFFAIVSAQTTESVVISWSVNEKYAVGLSYFKLPYFAEENFEFDTHTHQIVFKKRLQTTAFVNPKSIKILDINYESISKNYLFDVDFQTIPTSINLKIENTTARDEHFSTLQFSPIILENNVLKKVVSVTFSFETSNIQTKQNQLYSIENSVLDSGTWHRFYVQKSGVYKISKSFLQSLGTNVNIDPRTLKIYGNGGRMVPLNNNVNYPNDLAENAIEFIGQEDGVFNDSDYILMYCEGVDKWSNENQTHLNLYADKAYYYVTSGGNFGSRITETTQPTGTPNQIFTIFDDYQYYETDLINFAKASRKFYGEQFLVKNEQSFTFNIPNIITTTPAEVYVKAASVSYGNSSMEVIANGQSLGTMTFGNMSSAGIGVTGYENNLQASITPTTDINITLKYDNGSVPSSNGYLDYIYIKSKRNLLGLGKQFHFVNTAQATTTGIGQFLISNASSILAVWDITDVYNPKKYSNNQASFSFLTPLGQSKKYIALDTNDFYTPAKDANTAVANQNLKGTIFNDENGNFKDIDYLIITNTTLYNQAERLANFHRNYNNYNVKVVTTDKIYEEFGSGKQDIGAIRNFVKYVYWNASSATKRVRFLNLFGDASYDFKSRIKNNTNIVPTFQAVFSNGSNLNLISAFMSDDFFGLLDDSEGDMMQNSADGVDLAIGRMLVSSPQQADEMVDKVINYHTEKAYGKWRNNYVIYSDDVDTGSDASLQTSLNAVADGLIAAKPFMNVKKIISDSYIQDVSAGGNRYYKAKTDFLNSLELGTLIANYIGHGSEEVLASERLLEFTDAQNLKNNYKYPLFITMTCEFTRYDDPNRPTGGEYMYWNKNGGAIALIATTRPIFVSTAIDMNALYTQKVFNYGSNNHISIAEALRLTKILTNSTNRRVVSCVGDPALKLAIPDPKIRLTKINNLPVASFTGSLEALNLVKISGEVTDENNVPISSYNGDLFVQIFDKDIQRSTLGNDGTLINNTPIIMNFVTQGEAIFRGNASIINGQFELEFVVPKDIRIPIGNGKISFYAKQKNVLNDRTGYDTNIKIGGINTSAPADTTPPVVKLYMNDTSFINGGITNESPIFLAFLEDEHGINTASGIGHDIEAILDGNTENPYILNEYYETENNDYTKGKIRFSLKDLSVGLHTITFKAWDVYNNLITSEIQFLVVSDEGITLTHALNYPNPFVSYTQFWFTHNKPFEPLEVYIQIFTISGKLIKTINETIITDGFLSRTITWDGKDDFGDALAKGVYVYKLNVKATYSNQKAQIYEKLVIL